MLLLSGSSNRADLLSEENSGTTQFISGLRIPGVPDKSDVY